MLAKLQVTDKLLAAKDLYLWAKAQPLSDGDVEFLAGYFRRMGLGDTHDQLNDGAEPVVAGEVVRRRLDDLLRPGQVAALRQIAADVLRAWQTGIDFGPAILRLFTYVDE